MSDEPEIVDGEIIEEMKNLELMIAFHKKAQARGLEPDFFYPNELSGHLDVRLAAVAWDNAQYSTVRLTYARAWVSYYAYEFGDEPFYSVEQFSKFFRTD